MGGLEAALYVLFPARFIECTTVNLMQVVRSCSGLSRSEKPKENLQVTEVALCRYAYLFAAQSLGLAS